METKRRSACVLGDYSIRVRGVRGVRGATSFGRHVPYVCEGSCET